MLAAVRKLAAPASRRSATFILASLHAASLSTAAAMADPKSMSADDWRKALTPEQFQILRQKGTERPWTSEYNKFKEAGEFKCAGCGTTLFLSDHKFDSGCGWPSFFLPADKAAVAEHSDLSHFMVRTEVTCAKCGGHLGHVFDDGPRDKTGLRYCINGVALKFAPKGAAGSNASSAAGTAAK